MTGWWAPVLRGLGASAAIAAGYGPIAVSFGLAASQAGLAPLAAVLTSALVFAGASQFVLASLVAAGAGPLTAVPALWLINARHLFYGPALLNRLGRRPPGWVLPGLAFGLTDEVMATAVARLETVPEAERPRWYVGLWLGAYAAWLAGTVAGVWLIREIPPDWAWLRAALGFVLPALFLSLVLEFGVQRHRWAIGVAVALAAAALPVAPGHVALALGMVGGALAATLGPT